MKKIRKKSLLILAVIIISFAIGRNINSRLYEAQIDAVSSVSMNEHETLIVVANCHKIRDQKEFAQKVLQKYLDNSFRSIRLSTDQSEEISSLNVNVYLKKRHIKNSEPVMIIEYKFEMPNMERNIQEGLTHMEIFIDGQKMNDY